jgi:hypothetical protein
LNPVTGTSVTITVTIACNGKKVQNQIVVPIKQIENCRADFLITLQELQNGMYQVHGYQTPPVPGTMHYWFLQEVANCPSGSQVGGGLNLWAYIAPNGAVSYSNPNGGMTPGSTNWGFQFSGLTKGKCYRLYHYVYCCGQWKMSYKCFCLASGRMAIDLKALNENAVTKDVKVEELPADLRNRINQK